MDQEINDNLLVSAMRKRILDEINKREQAHQASVTNNVYGGSGEGSHHKMSGVGDQLGQAHEGEDPYDYFVDITRKDLPDINPHTGKPAGWEKSVHRHRKKKMNPNLSSPSALKD